MHVSGELWINAGESGLAGEKRIELLRRIDETGSITHAAKAIGMSYKAAWDAVNAMNNLSGHPLVARSAGGKGGGGTRLTEEGRALVANFALIQAEHRHFLQTLGAKLAHGGEHYRLLQRINMKTSARNQLYGRISAIRRGAVNDIVELVVAGGDTLSAQITHESTERLGLRADDEVVALIKAPWVIVGAADAGCRLSADNRLTGHVIKLTPGAVNTEVVLQLKGSNTLSAVVTNESASQLELREGQPLAAFFSASQVIIGVPG